MANKKAFAQLTTSLLSTKRWTLGAYKTQFNETIAPEMWKMKLPGLRNSAQAVQTKDELRVLESLTDEELEDRVLVNGIRLRRVARQSETPVTFVNDVLARYDQMVVMHKWMHSRHKAGEKLPTTLDETMTAIANDPRARNDMREMYVAKVVQRRMRRRGQ